MANVTTTYTMEQGNVYGVYYCLSGASTPTDLTDSVILDVSTLGTIPAKMVVEKIAVHISGVMTLIVEFNDATDSLIFAGGSIGGGSTGTSFNWDSSGMDLIVGPTISGATGDIQVTTVGMTVADEGFTLGLILRGTT